MNFFRMFLNTILDRPSYQFAHFFKLFETKDDLMVVLTAFDIEACVNWYDSVCNILVFFEHYVKSNRWESVAPS